MSIQNPQYQAVETPEGMKMVCGWVAACTNTTDKATQHPILGPVPICTQHAQQHDISELLDIDVSVED